MGIMTTSNLDRLVEEVRALTPDEKRVLRERLDSLLGSPQPEISEADFERRLLERGVISSIPPPITDFEPYRNRKLIDVKGKPLSETIIEERR
jgi:hypothetical protein